MPHDSPLPVKDDLLGVAIHKRHAFRPAGFGPSTSRRGDPTEKSSLMITFSNGPDVVRGLWNSSPDAMVLTNAEGTVLAANPSYCALHGLSSKRLVGQSMAIIFAEVARPSVMAHYREVFASRSNVHAYPATLRWGDAAGRVMESRIDFISRDGCEETMMSSVRVAVEATGRISVDGVSQESAPKEAGDETSHQPDPFTTPPRADIGQNTPELLLEAIQTWGVHTILGVPISRTDAEDSK